ncbi:MAG: enoyl-CoA hydratase/isomerase family protein [Gammaproteobacteria bacterium]|nr:enoyl-CoA hydratase/isomerase family protein [Gammaproteobacteria bacterium]
MTSASPLLLDIDPHGLARLTINRPQVHNAFDDDLIERLIAALASVAADSSARVLLLCAVGESYSAGADLHWMRRMADYTREQNRADAARLALLMERLNTLGKPTVARVQGAAYGGGVGLIACCDIAVAVATARFALTEVRLGLIPAVISPYVISAIGERAARRYFLTAERFSATEAHRLGLIHEVVESAQLDHRITDITQQLLRAGPQALGAAKSLISAVARRPIDSAVIDDTVERITQARGSDEGREGLGAFLGKRAPAWIEGKG